MGQGRVDGPGVGVDPVDILAVDFVLLAADMDVDIKFSHTLGWLFQH